MPPEFTIKNDKGDIRYLREGISAELMLDDDGNLYDVREDNIPKSKGRTLKITEIDHNKRVVTFEVV